MIDRLRWNIWRRWRGSVVLPTKAAANVNPVREMGGPPPPTPGHESVGLPARPRPDRVPTTWMALAHEILRELDKGPVTHAEYAAKTLADLVIEASELPVG